MILILDIGNSVVEIGAFSKERLLARVTFPTKSMRTAADIRRTLDCGRTCS